MFDEHCVQLDPFKLSLFDQVMTSIVFNSVPLETTDDNWGTNPVLDRINTVIRELRR